MKEKQSSRGIILFEAKSHLFESIICLPVDSGFV